MRKSFLTDAAFSKDSGRGRDAGGLIFLLMLPMRRHPFVDGLVASLSGRRRLKMFLPRKRGGGRWCL